MQLIRPDINIPFIQYRKFGFAFSSVLIVLTAVLFFARGGIRYGVEFTGGATVHFKFEKDVDLADVRAAVSSVAPGDAQVQRFGGGVENEVLARVAVPEGGDLVGIAGKVSEAVEARFPDQKVEVLGSEAVGPTVGGELKQRGWQAFLLANLGILIYVAWRFELRYAIGAVLAHTHDVIITVGALLLLDKEFTLQIIAALLTIVGYSLNDTVVIYDRIRENVRRYRRMPLEEVMNKSINETLARTINTTATMFFVVVALFFLGGAVIHDFAYAMLIGVLAGVYSTIFIASPLVLLQEKLGWFAPNVGDKPKSAKQGA